MTDFKGIWNGRAALLQEGPRNHPPGIEGTKMLGKGLELLCGLPGVKASPPYQHHPDSEVGTYAV